MYVQQEKDLIPCTDQTRTEPRRKRPANQSTAQTRTDTSQAIEESLEWWIENLIRNAEAKTKTLLIFRLNKKGKYVDTRFAKFRLQRTGTVAHKFWKSLALIPLNVLKLVHFS